MTMTPQVPATLTARTNAESSVPAGIIAEIEEISRQCADLQRIRRELEAEGAEFWARFEQRTA